MTDIAVVVMTVRRDVEMRQIGAAVVHSHEPVDVCMHTFSTALVPRRHR